MSHQIVVQTLKQILKAKKINYSQLSAEIGMSESGIKKLFTAKDISLSRLTQIAKVIGISLAEILRIAEEEEIKSVHLTHKQEEALFNDTHLFRVFWFLSIEEKSSEEIRKIEKMNVEKFQKCLFKLEALDLIKIGKNNRAVPVHKGLYRWTNEGKLLKKLNKEWSESTLHKVLQDRNNPQNYHQLSYLKLSAESRDQMYARIKELMREYAQRSCREKIEKPASRLVPISTLIAIAQSEFTT